MYECRHSQGVAELADQRTELWKELSLGHDAEKADECRRLSEAMDQLGWSSGTHGGSTLRPAGAAHRQARAEARLEDELTAGSPGAPARAADERPRARDRSGGARLTVDEEHPGSALSRGFASAGGPPSLARSRSVDRRRGRRDDLASGAGRSREPAARRADPQECRGSRGGPSLGRAFPDSDSTEIALVERRQSGLTEDEVTGIGERAAAIVDAGGAHPSRALYALPIVNDPRLFPEAREQGTTAVTWLAFPLDEGLHVQREWAEQIAAESEVGAREARSA